MNISRNFVVSTTGHLTVAQLHGGGAVDPESEVAGLHQDGGGEPRVGDQDVDVLRRGRGRGRRGHAALKCHNRDSKSIA